MNSMGEPINKIKVAHENTDFVKEHERRMGAFEVLGSFVSPYRNSLDIILTGMLIRISEARITHKDKLMFTSRITDLFNKLAGSYYYEGKAPDADPVLRDIIIQTKQNLAGAKYIQGYAKKHNIDLNIIEELISIIEKYRKFRHEYDKLTNDFKQMPDYFARES